jgi:hypothetical protein
MGVEGCGSQEVLRTCHAQYLCQTGPELLLVQRLRTWTSTRAMLSTCWAPLRLLQAAARSPGQVSRQMGRGVVDCRLVGRIGIKRRLRDLTGCHLLRLLPPPT